MISPTHLDIWVAHELAGYLNRSRLFDMAVQSGIRHNVLGGTWYAGALFVLWVQGTRQNQDAVRLRILTTIVGSVLTIVLTLLAALVVSWPPPVHTAGLAGHYPSFLDANPNTNCFPSQSTAVYGSIAAGIYSLHKTAGWLLWAVLPVAVSLPRMYVGGHFLSDIIAGVALAIAGYSCARYLLEPSVLPSLLSHLPQRREALYVLDLLVFAWILEVAVEFTDLVWLVRGFKMIL